MSFKPGSVPQDFFIKRTMPKFGDSIIILTGQILTSEQQKREGFKVSPAGFFWYRDLKMRDLDKVFFVWLR